MISKVSSQVENKRDYVWVRGYDQNAIQPGGEGTLINFNGGEVSFNFIDNEMNMRLMNASICDPEGNLLFYTNGCFIADASHQKMLNGDSLNYPGLIYDNNCGNGAGYTAGGGATILPHPDSSEIYYLFHVKKTFHQLNPNEFEFFGHPLYYTKVDMSKNNGLGAVIEKNQIAIADTLHQGHLAAVKHANGKDWWVLIPKDRSNIHFSVLFTSDGLSDVYQQEIGDAQLGDGDGVGQAVFSPDGTKFAKYEGASQLYLYDFNRETGELSNFQKICADSSLFGGGIAFSANSRFIYVANPSRVFQFDTWANDVAESKILIAEWDGFSVGGIHPVSFNRLLLGPDCRIYINTPSTTSYMHVIMNPDLLGQDCDLRQHAIMTPSWLNRSLPNFPNYRLGVEPTYPCDSTINLETIVSIDHIFSDQNQIKVFPNPTNDKINFSLMKGVEGKIIFYNSIGQMVESKKLSTQDLEYQWSLRHLKNGIYYYSIFTKNEIIKNGKIVLID